MLLAAALPGQGQTPPDSPLGSLLETFHIKGKVPPAPDFVTQSRPKSTDSLPVATPHPARGEAVLDPAALAAETATLDAERVRQQQRAGVRPGVVPLKPGRPAKKTVQ